jgi:hypothetical protein
MAPTSLTQKQMESCIFDLREIETTACCAPKVGDADETNRSFPLFDVFSSIA